MRNLKAALCAAFFVLPLAAPVLAQETAMREEARITVTGEGRVDARPDMATIMLGVTTQADTAAAAMTANSAELARVLDRLKAAGIDARDLQTTGLSLNPNWQSYDNAQPKIIGYVATNNLNVRVRALDNLGTVLDSAVKDGANTLNGLSFGFADAAPMMDEARRRAVADAIARATLLTGAAGVPLGRVVSITEGGGFSAPAPMFRMEAAMASDAVPVAEGEVSTMANVTMVFAIAE